MAQGSDGGEMGEHGGFAGSGVGFGGDINDADGDHKGDSHGSHGSHGSEITLAVGLGSGHGYLHEMSAAQVGMDFFAADNDGGHHCDRDHHAGEHNERSIFDRDTTAHCLALDLLTYHGGGNSLEWHPMGHLADIPAFKGYARDCGQMDQGRQVPLPGIGRNAATVEVLAYPHRACDVMGFIDRISRKVQTGTGFFGSMLRLQGVVEITPPVNNAPKPIIKEAKEVLSLSPFADKVFGRMPIGHFAGIGGKSLAWRRLWQVQPLTWWLVGQPKFMAWQTFLVETGCCWNYEDGLSESRVAFSTWSQGYTEHGNWRYDWDQIKMHRDCAEQFAAQLWRFLADNPADPRALKARVERQSQPATPTTGTATVAVPRKKIDLTGFPGPNAFLPPEPPVEGEGEGS